jgi:hypothetical protein
MKTLKLSHSIISQWKEGKYEEAIGQYLGKPYPSTPAMELGSLYDKKWNEHILKTGELPNELGGGKLNNPRVQIKYAVRLPLSEEYEILLRGVPDLTEDDMITDFKCGRTEANSYVGKMQLDYYALFKPQATTGRYLCYNPYKDTLTVGIKFLTQQNRDDAINDIVTYGADILQYLLANKLFRDYTN